MNSSRPRHQSTSRKSAAFAAILSLLVSGVISLSLPAQATTATELVEGERLSFVPSADDVSNQTNGVDSDGDIHDPASSGDSYRYKDVHPTFADVDAVVTVLDFVNLADGETADRLEKLDDKTSDATIDKFIRTDADVIDDDLHGTATFRVEFFVSGTSTRVTFPSIGVNAYDIDNDQFVEFEGHSSVQLFPSSAVTPGTPVSGVQRFTGGPDNTSSSGGFGADSATAYTAGRVKVNYTNAHTIVFRIGAWKGSGFEFDFGPGVAWGAGQAPVSQSPQQVASPAVESVMGSPVKSVVTINPTSITVDREIITLTGANLDTATEVYVGGVKAEIFSQSKFRLQVLAPRGLTGLVDLELRGSLNSVVRLLALEFISSSATVASERKAKIVVGGFAPNSKVLTNRIMKRIERLIDRYPELNTVRCTGFTSLPRRANDVRLSTNRGTEACKFAKAYKASLTVVVRQGIEDPRPGSNIRRVRVALTK